MATQASLRSAFGVQPTSVCQRVALPKTSAVAARLAVSYAVAAMSVTDIWPAPTETKPATEVSPGASSAVVSVPSSDWTEVRYSA